MTMLHQIQQSFCTDRKMTESFEISDLKVNLIEHDFIIHWDRNLGTGVSGPVRLCEEKSTGKHFALKCVIATPRSRREIYIHQLLTGHPHIVSLYRVYHNSIRIDGDATPRARLLLVMELMEGGELFDRISNEHCFTEDKAARYMMQIAQAVLCLHQRNIAHRDLKPENFLLTDPSEKATVKLADFGFAKEDNGNLVTPLFSPLFVAPQVLQALDNVEPVEKEGRQPAPYTYDKSCDMWSLGVTLYIMLCGYPPFHSENPEHGLSSDMYDRIMAGDYNFPHREWATITQDAKDIVQRLLYVDPEKRMTAQELVAHPWLTRTSELHSTTPLSSPVAFSDKNRWDEVKQAYDQEVTQLRLADSATPLKSLDTADNPVIRKRRRRRIVSKGDSSENSIPPSKLPAGTLNY